MFPTILSRRFALRARGKLAVVLPHAFGLPFAPPSACLVPLPKPRRTLCSPCATRRRFSSSVRLPKIFLKRAHKRAFSRLVRSFSHIADTVLKKVEKHTIVQHVHMTTRAPSYDDTWSAVVVRTQRTQQSLPKVEKPIFFFCVCHACLNH
jgi:hypothetical protein